MQTVDDTITIFKNLRRYYYEYKNQYNKKNYY
nr:MAG TPA: hypothetical protein [Caudoviricetes sp.]